MSLFFVLLASQVIGKQMATVSKTLSGCTLMETVEKSETTTNKKRILILKLQCLFKSNMITVTLKQSKQGQLDCVTDFYTVFYTIYRL